MILAEIFARIEVDQLIEDLKKTGKTKLFEEIMEACEIYGLKHYARADKSLKSSYFLKYVMSQITLQSDLRNFYLLDIDLIALPFFSISLR